MHLARTVSLVSLCLLLLGVALQPRRVGAQEPAQEKRIALVIGDGAYAKGPLATAANDAGLIAQTLQAAGFDVIGARDLDGDALRNSFRDFMQKALSADGNTVAMVYLAGYGLQLAGENYFIPVDSTIGRYTDIPTVGLRLSDYIRQLAAIPLKASIVVLDAARQQPFIEGGPPMAGGLALVEPAANLLIAFNAAPGSIATDDSGSYGVYAQSLAEMIRTGGLSLPEVFDRVRLRVSEATRGAQVPWDAQKIQVAFTFFDRAPDAPAAQVTPAQTAAIRDSPIRDLGAQEAYSAALERDTLPAYEEFLTAHGSDPLAKRVRAIVAIRREAITWRRTYQNDMPDAYWSYLTRYPNGPHAEDARRRLAILTAPLEPPASFAMLEYDVPPPARDEIVYVDRQVLAFSDPEFAFAPPPPPPPYMLPPQPPDFVVLAPPIAPVGLFILPQPLFVPMPEFVLAPARVAPPPNDVIFANIHNATIINAMLSQPPSPAPGEPGGPGASGHAGTGPDLPASVVQRATLIKLGQLPAPPSAAISEVARRGTPGPAQAILTPGVVPQVEGMPNATLSHADPLPTPGETEPPPAATGSITPQAILSPSAALPAGSRRPHKPRRGKTAVPPTQTTVAPGRVPFFFFLASRPPPGAPAAPSAKPPSAPQRPVVPTVAPMTRPDAQRHVDRAAAAAMRLSKPAAPSGPVTSRPAAPMVRIVAPPALPPRPAAPATARPMVPPVVPRPTLPPRIAASAAKKCPPNGGHC